MDKYVQKKYLIGLREQGVTSFLGGLVDPGENGDSDEIEWNLPTPTQFSMPNPNKIVSKSSEQKKVVKTLVFSKMVKIAFFDGLIVFWEFLTQNLVESE